MVVNLNTDRIVYVVLWTNQLLTAWGCPVDKWDLDLLIIVSLEMCSDDKRRILNI
jgi:hypothetical protein